MHQAWLLLATVGISATSLGQYSGNRYLDSAIDKTWQRHGGGFLNQESYAHDASKERKISTTIGSFGTPLTPNLGGKYDIPEYSSIYIPEVSLAGGTERLLEINHEPLKAIEGGLYDHKYMNKYGTNYDRDVLTGLAKDNDKVLYKEYKEHTPYDVLYREKPVDKDRVSIVKQAHPSIQEEYLVEKFRKDPFGKDHYTTKKHHPKGDVVVVDTIYKDLPKSGHIEVKTHEKIYKDAYTPLEDFHGKDHLMVKTEEKVFRDKFDPTMDRFYVDKTHKNIPVGDHVVHETVYKDLKHPGTKLIEKEHAVLGSHEKFYRDGPMPKEHILLDKLYKDPYGKDSVALTHDKTYKNIYESPDHRVSIKTEEIYQPKLGGFGKDHLTVKTEEKIFSDPDKVTVENIYRPHSIGKPELFDKPYFGYEKEYSDDKIGFEHSNDKQLYKLNEKHVKVEMPLEERLSTFSTRPTYRSSWSSKEKSCDMSQYKDNPEC